MFIRYNRSEDDPVVRGMNAYLDDLHAQGKTLMDVSKEAGETQPREDDSTAAPKGDTVRLRSK